MEIGTPIIGIIIIKREKSWNIENHFYTKINAGPTDPQYTTYWSKYIYILYMYMSNKLLHYPHKDERKWTNFNILFKISFYVEKFQWKVELWTCVSYYFQIDATKEFLFVRVSNLF